MKAWSNSEIPGETGSIPEKRLLVAVLQRAVTDFVTGEGDLCDGAKLWLMEDDEDNDAPLSFRFICEALDMDVDNLRKAIALQAELYSQGLLEEVAV